MEAISAREEDLAARENMLIIDDDEIPFIGSKKPKTAGSD